MEIEQGTLFETLYQTKKIDKPIRLIELFAGIGSQYKSLKRLGANVESYKIVEWAYNSIIGYNAIHHQDNTDYAKDMSKEDLIQAVKGISMNYNEPMTEEQLSRKGIEWLKNAYNNIKATHNLVNIMNVKGSDLEIVDTDKYEYIMTYSFPCITENSLILTEKGYIPFKDVKVGMKVLTKGNTWEKVAKIFNNGIHETFYLNASGFENIEITGNHKFWVRTMYRQGHYRVRKFTDPSFKEAKDLTKNDYLGIPVIKEEEPFYTNDLDFWFMLGMYVGDGWLPKTGNEIIICGNDKKINLLKQKLDVNKWKYTCNKQNTCIRFRFSNKEIRQFIERYIGSGSLDKHIPLEIIKLPKEQLQAFYDGYLSSDGSIVNGVHKFSSINQNLIYSFSLIANKLFKRPTRIYKINTPDKYVIQGRIVNQKDYYQLVVKTTNSKQDKSFYENGYIWFPFKSLEKARTTNVYNMEVENDHSYILQGCISKNCQDLSNAGLKKGCDVSQAEGGTRSGLLWEVERILNELEEKPQILVCENVPDLLNKKNIHNFKKWLNALTSMGYKNYTQVLNGKDYGIPQNRKRVFIVSLLGDYNYTFPRKQKLKLKLKDMLEDNVDEKYYLSDSKLESISKWKAQQDPLKDIDKEKAVSPTITARGAGEEHSGMILINENVMCSNVEGSLFTNQQGEMINEDGNIKRYIHSDKVDEFKEGQVADISYPNGYNKAKRTHDECPAINTTTTESSFITKISQVPLRIRKLTPCECMRLMGFDDEDYNALAEKLSGSAIYHIAGDSIIVNVLESIFKQML